MFGVVRGLDEKYCYIDEFSAFCKITDSNYLSSVYFENRESFLSATYPSRVPSSCPDNNHDQECKTPGH